MRSRCLFILSFLMLGISSVFAQKYPDVLFPGESNGKRPVPYTSLREADVMYSKRVWRVMDLRQKMNFSFYYPEEPAQNMMSMFDVIKKGVREGKLTAFGNPLTDDEFRFEMTIADFEKLIMSYDSAQIQNAETLEFEKVGIPKPVESSHVWKYWIKEDWFYDKQRGVMDVRILGICPVVEKISESGEHLGADKPLFWIYFPEARPVFATAPVFMRHNDAARRTLDELFWKRLFSSYVRKESNVYNRGIYDYRSGLDQLLEAERVKDDIFKFEHDLWHF